MSETSIASPAHVRVGIGVFIFNSDGELLLGLRQGAHGSDTWALPGGHLEFGETPEHCAQREAFEETGIHINHPEFVGYSNDIFTDEQSHYITLFIKGTAEQYEAVIKEPLKCKSWQWFSPQKLPSPLFAPLKSFIDNHQAWQALVNE